MHIEKVTIAIAEAIECSVFVNPREPGLSYEEIVETLTRAGFKEGEIADAYVTMGLHAIARGSRLLGPGSPTRHLWKFFLREIPEYRDFAAFDFVYTEFGELARNVGQAAARIDRSTLVARAIPRGIAEIGIQTTITILIFAEYLEEKDGMLRFKAPVYGDGPLPSAQLTLHSVGTKRETRAELLPFVKDVIARRIDGRPKHTEPIDAFAERLGSLGHSAFRSWWMQIGGELRRADVQSSSISICVLSAALVEGVLAFVVKHARSKHVGPFGSKDFEREPRFWKIEELVGSAAAGGASSILDATTRQRADNLIRTRQRIHAGRVLQDHPAGLPDLRPEEARDAKQTAELVVRNVLDWLDKFPPDRT